MRMLIAAATALVLLTTGSAWAQSLEKTYEDLCSDPAKAKSEACVALAQALAIKLERQRTEPALQPERTPAAGDATGPILSPVAAAPESPERRSELATRFLDQLAGRTWTNGAQFHEFQWTQRGVSMSINGGNLGTYAPTITSRIEIDPTTGILSHRSSVLLSTGLKETERIGSIRPDGALRQEPTDKTERGTTWRMLSPDQFEWAWDAYNGKKPFLSVISRAEWAEMIKAGVMVLWPIDLAKAHAQKRGEIDAAAARQQAAHSQERAAQRANQQALYNVLQGELAVATTQEAASRADMDSTLANINAQAEAQRAAEAQSQRRLQGGQQSAIQAPASPGASQQSAQRGHAQTSGSIMVESTPSAVPAQPSASSAKNSGEEFIYCVVVRSGNFEQHDGALFFSEIALITIDYSRPLDGPPRAFSAEVKAAYNLPGGSPGCSTNKDRAKLERLRQEQFDSIAFRAHKKVMTGIVPRN